MTRHSLCLLHWHRVLRGTFIKSNHPSCYVAVTEKQGGRHHAISLRIDPLEFVRQDLRANSSGLYLDDRLQTL